MFVSIKRISVRQSSRLDSARCAHSLGVLGMLMVCFLLEAAGQHAGGAAWRAVPVNVGAGGKPGFTRLPSQQTGITFTNHLSDALAEQNRILENGSGVALGDVDGDGQVDLYFCKLEGANVLYRNLGHWKFVDATAQAGVACEGQFSTGAAFADVDGDRDLDLLVNSVGGGTRLFRNDGQGRFTEDTASGLSRKSGATSLALADIEGDGDLDLYVANYRTTTIRDNPPEDYEIRKVEGKIIVRPPERFRVIQRGPDDFLVNEVGEEDILYLNDGQGRFTSVPWFGGAFLDDQGKPLTSPPRGWGLSVMMRDFTGDGAPDIYVCNDFADSPDHVWINDGRGRFRAAPRLALRNSSLSSMSVDFADINRDGFVDFFVVDMLSRDHRLWHTQRANLDIASLSIRIGEIENRPQVPRNTLFLNRGDGSFAEIAQLSGVQASEWSWSAIFLDVDLDGFEDILVTTGNGHDVQDADTATRTMAMAQGVPRRERPKTLLLHPRLLTPKIAFRNRGDLTFEEIGAAWGFNDVGIAQGMALADLDGDGDLDAVGNQFNAEAGIYRNNSSSPRLAVRLKGASPNTQAIGAKIKVLGGPVTQEQEVISGGRYLSGDDPMRVFAAGSSTNFDIEVTWRNGRRSLVAHARPNHVFEITEPAFDTAKQTNIPAALPAPPFFRDVSELLKHTHFEPPFDDFGRQLLLPHRFSQLGPGVAWQDLNGDGWEDLIIGSGRGGQSSVFLNEQGRSFTPVLPTEKLTPAAGDQTTVLGWFGKSGSNELLVGVSNYESGSRAESSVIRYALRNGKLEEAGGLPGQLAEAGPLALADIDNDGDLDLFVGGRSIPGRYPEAATSRIYRNEKGELRLDRQRSELFVELGLVSGAVFSDLDGDGDSDLVLACEYSPVRIFRNDQGQFAEVTATLGFAGFSGRWNGVTTGDFDGDGRMDIVASNWGRNTKYQRHLAQPIRVFFGDFDQNGVSDILETYFNPPMNQWVPWRGRVSVARALPFVQERLPTFAAYASAGAGQILGDTFQTAKQLNFNTLDSMIFLNRGDRFEPRALPVEAQLAPAFGVCAGDLDGDGHEDIFLSQNFFAVHPETSRYDAGCGLWLKGDGAGNFASVPAEETGVFVHGEQRGCALADFDHDGRVDFVVTQNGAPTRLFRNKRAQPGLRVRLQGPSGNPTGIGARIRLRFGEKIGPAREIHAGSGYWSQDGVVQVLAAPEPPTAIQVQWNSTNTTDHALQPGANEAVVFWKDAR